MDNLLKFTKSMKIKIHIPMKTVQLMMDLKMIFRKIKNYLHNLLKGVKSITTQELKKLMENTKDLVNQLKLL